MRTKELENRKIEFEKLMDYGFEEIDDCYIYSDNLLNGEFRMIVEIAGNKKMVSKVIELENNEEYILVDVSSARGEFVGRIKEEYENKLQDIIEKCTAFDVFKSEQANQVIQYVKENYGDELEFLWQKFDNNAVWRNKKNNKWYGALLIIAENKIGIDSDKIIEIIDLRYQKEAIKDFVDNKEIFPGYHMNKNNWITIKLDGSVETQKIFELVDNSYNMSLEK